MTKELASLVQGLNFGGRVMTKELASLVQGLNGITEGSTNTMFYMTHDKIHNMPTDRTVV
jgi:hypothetical protein